MNGEVGGRRQSGIGRLESPAPGRSQGGGRGRGGASRGNHKAQSIARGIGAQQANILQSRVSSGLATLKVDGLHLSKAASNSDRGLEALLGFLERKAAGRDSKSNRPVRIRKVC
jgi:nuclear RNA export factor